MNSNRTIAKKLVITYLVAFAGLAQAKSGEVTTNLCVSGEILSSTEIAPQQSIVTAKYFGVMKTVPSGGIIDLMSITCHGTVSTVGGPPVFNGHCVYVDKDGDKFASRVQGVPGGGKSEVLGGSGKFTGMKGGNEYKSTRVASLPGTISVCNEAQWKYTLPD